VHVSTVLSCTNLYKVFIPDIYMSVYDINNDTIAMTYGEVISASSHFITGVCFLVSLYITIVYYTHALLFKNVVLLLAEVHTIGIK